MTEPARKYRKKQRALRGIFILEPWDEIGKQARGRWRRQERKNKIK